MRPLRKLLKHQRKRIPFQEAPIDNNPHKRAKHVLAKEVSEENSENVRKRTIIIEDTYSEIP